MCKNSLSPALVEKFAELDAFIAGLNISRDDPRRRGRLIQVLHRAQHIFGYLPREVQCHVAEKLYLHFVAAMRRLCPQVETGRFRAEMAVELCNDGPVTIMVDTEK